MPTQKQASEHLRDMIKDIRIAMMTTQEPDGTLRSRPMYVQQLSGDDNLWFFTREDSGKVQEIMHDKDINLSFSETGNNRYVSVSGRAQTVDDMNKKEEFWNPMLKAWFPDGLDDPNLLLLKVKPSQGEYWDAPSSKMVQLAGFVKATVTGEAYQPDGTNEKVSL